LDRIAKVLVCSGKIYYQLWQRCQDIGSQEIAIVRMEQLYPFPKDALQSILASYSRAEEFVWVQEEPENMGAWQFMRAQLERLTGKPPGYVGRPAAASPATGFAKIHAQQQEALSDQAVGPVIT
jgi:2-oxoglutarate dehydrogenase E1 component